MPRGIKSLDRRVLLAIFRPFNLHRHGAFEGSFCPSQCVRKHGLASIRSSSEVRKGSDLLVGQNGSDEACSITLGVRLFDLRKGYSGQNQE
jgi:hypothetical protein